MSILKYPNTVSLVMNLLESISKEKEGDVKGLYIRMPANDVKLTKIFKKYFPATRLAYIRNIGQIVDIKFYINLGGKYTIEIYLKDNWKDVSSFSRYKYENIPETTTIKMIIDELLRSKGVVHKMHAHEYYDSNDYYDSSSESDSDDNDNIGG